MVRTPNFTVSELGAGFGSIVDASLQAVADVNLDLMRPNQSLSGLTARCVEGLDLHAIGLDLLRHPHGRVKHARFIQQRGATGTIVMKHGQTPYSRR